MCLSLFHCILRWRGLKNLKQVGLQQPLMTHSECLKTYVGAFLAFQSTSQNHLGILPVVYEDL